MPAVFESMALKAMPSSSGDRHNRGGPDRLVATALRAVV
jgi:hypothetical protein